MKANLVVKLNLIIFFCFIISNTITGKNIYVQSTGIDTNEGTKLSPYKTLGKALLMVENNDSIFILDMLNVKDELTGNGIGQMENGNGGVLFPTDKINVTVIGSNRNNSGFTGTTNKGMRILNINGSNGFTFKNLTFKNGLFAVDSACPDGGTIYARDCSVRFESCDFTLNGYTKAIYGGAIRIENAIVTIEDCLFYDNYSPNGGAIYISGGELIINNSTFEKGQSINGGAIYSDVKGNNLQSIQHKEVKIVCKNTVFENNKAGSGGAINVTNSIDIKAADLYFESCSFIENKGQGGAVFLSNKKSGLNQYLFANSTFYRNNSATNGGGLLLWAGQKGETLDLVNCTFIENTTDGNSGHGGGIRFYTEDSETHINSSRNVVKRIINCLIENNYATNGGGGNSSSDLSLRYTPTLGDLIMKNSFVGVDGNSTINLGDYMNDNMINYYGAVESLAGIPLDTKSIIEQNKSIGVSQQSIAANYGDATYLQQLGIHVDQRGVLRPFTDGRCTVGSVEVIPDLTNVGGEVSGHPVYPSYKGLIMAGYQGWFSVIGDNSGENAYVHLGKNGKFEAGNASIEFWPDMTEYTKKYPVNFKHTDGSQAYFFSSSDEETIDLHFKWMQEHNIDGVFIQRFISSIRKNSIGKVLKFALQAAKKYNRSICIMYDLSGLGSDEDNANANKVLNDWRIINTKYRLTDPSVCPTYLHHNGKPLVALWGIGIGDNVSGFENVMSKLENLKGETGELSYMLGSAYYWRNGGGDTSSNTTELKRVLKKGDIISPWSVGRYQNMNEYRSRVETNLKPDIAWCEQNGVDYAPVVLPGFSWRNLKNLTPDRYDQISRVKGDFLWTQIANSIQSGAEMVYVAMFDELDEGTCIFKCANNKDVPVYATVSDPQGRILGIDDELPTDYYLFLVGEGVKWLKGGTGYSTQKPTYSTSIDNLDASDLFPVQVSCRDMILHVHSQTVAKTNVGLFNLTGQCVFNLTNEDVSIPFNKSVNLQNLPGGIYLVHVQQNKLIKTFKIII